MSSRAAYRAWETMRDRDERVVMSLPADLVPLWQRIKASIRGETPHERAEAFLHYCHENEGEIAAAIQYEADATLARLVSSTRPDHVKAARLEAGRKAAKSSRKIRVGKVL